MRVHVFTTLFASTAIAAITGMAMGQINYVSQTRSVYASTLSGSQTFSNADLGPWSQGAISSYTWNGAPVSGCSANQTSDLAESAITFDAFTTSYSMNGHSTSGNSVLDVTFTLNEARAFALVRSSDFNGSHVVRLDLGSTNIFNSQLSPFPSNTSGVLQPGQYRFRVEVFAYNVSVGPDGQGRARGVFYVPTPSTAAALLVGLSVATTRRRRS